jgi:hypothetical protein
MGRYYKYHLIKRHIYLSHGKGYTFYDHFRIYIYKIYLDVLWNRIYLIVDLSYRCCTFKMLYTIIRHKNGLRLFRRYLLASKAFNKFELYSKRFLIDIKYIIHHIICLFDPSI